MAHGPLPLARLGHLRSTFVDLRGYDTKSSLPMTKTPKVQQKHRIGVALPFFVWVGHKLEFKIVIFENRRTRW